MDTTPKYILMCEKAKEIQKVWKPTFNDFACDKDDLFYPDRIKSVNSCADGEYTGTMDSVHYDSAIDECIWLPRQDQLQEMVGRMSFLVLLDDFYSFLSDYYNKKYPAFCFDSMEQLWLGFVMREKYHKIWNGKDWVKDEKN